MKDIYILGIESSCDETSCSIVKNGREVLSNVINFYSWKLWWSSTRDSKSWTCKKHNLRNRRLS